ncbi:MAG: DUF1285 domain-containing protein [Candidatus Binataceae bacterium]|jgi:hypothetical protein
MARAGFYAVESGKISFRRDGRWYVDDELIDNPRIALLFSRSIRQTPDCGYFLQIGDERASITVEDTPYVVKSIKGDAPQGFSVLLNDDTVERLDPSSLAIGRDNVLYCSVKHGQHRARFLRPAYYHLSDSLQPDEHGGFCFVTMGKRYPLRHAAGGASDVTDAG